MANFVTAQVGLSYPKGRSVLTKIVPLLRTDSSTVKCVLPKDSVVCGIHVYQNTLAVTGSNTYNIGWSGNTTALVNAFSMSTTNLQLKNPDTTVGGSLFTKLTSDTAIISTNTVGSSTAGGTGYLTIEYFLTSGNDQVDD